MRNLTPWVKGYVYHHGSIPLICDKLRTQLFLVIPFFSDAGHVTPAKLSEGTSLSSCSSLRDVHSTGCCVTTYTTQAAV